MPLVHPATDASLMMNLMKALILGARSFMGFTVIEGVGHPWGVASIILRKFPGRSLR